MANPAGARVVERDYGLLAALATARYLTAEQVARLVFPGLDERVPRRRLNRLSRRGPHGLPPLVRGLAYRGALGAPLKAWALTEAGYVVGKQLVPHATVPGSDVGAAFVEHALLLNDLLVELIEKTNPGPAWFTSLPFRWLAEGGDCLAFDYYDRAKQAIERGRIRPDATLEIGEPRRRLFLECETGSRTLVSLDPTNTGATWAKIQRYTNLIAGSAGQHDATTPYSLLCPDGFAPVVVFLAHSERRRDAIRKLLADPKRALRIKVRAYTFQEVAGVLAALVPGQPAPVLDAEVAQLTASQLELLQAALSAAEGAAGATRQVPGHQGSAGREKAMTEEGRASKALREARALLARLRAVSGTGGPVRRAQGNGSGPRLVVGSGSNPVAVKKPVQARPASGRS